MPVPNCIGQHTLASMTRRTRCAWAACPFHLVSSHPVYGSFRCIWPTLHSYFSQTPPELILKWTDAHLFRGHGLLVCLLLKHSHIYPCCKWIVFSLDFFFTFISRTRAWHATWPVCLIWLASIQWQMNMCQNSVEFDWTLDASKWYRKRLTVVKAVCCHANINMFMFFCINSCIFSLPPATLSEQTCNPPEPEIYASPFSK